MTIQPEDIANDLVSRINLFLDDKSKANDLALRSIKNDAQKLLNINYIKANVVLACAAYFEHKTQLMLDYYKRALAGNHYDYVAHTNYAVSLYHTGRNLEAIEVLRDLENHHGDGNVELISLLRNFSYSAGDFRATNEYYKRLEKLNVYTDEHEILPFIIDKIETCRIDESQLKAYYQCAFETLQSNDVYPEGVIDWLGPDDDVVREILVSLEPDAAAELNVELSKNVSNKNFSTDLLMNFCVLFTVE